MKSGDFLNDNRGWITRPFSRMAQKPTFTLPHVKTVGVSVIKTLEAWVISH
jgi:hypothetical protein